MVSVLVVDDNDAECYALQKTLQHLGYVVTCAHNGESAVRQAIIGQFDAIVLDIHMPDIDGFEVCRRIRETDGMPQPAIIFHSGTSAANVGPDSSGADAFLTAPVEPEHLSSVIAGAMSRRGLRKRLAG